MAPAKHGRLLYGGILFYTAVENLRDMEGRIQYAEAKGVPVPNVLVPVASGLLLLGSVGLILWRYPRLSAAAVASFLLGVTPVMHDFWNAEGQERTGEKNQFLKNITMLGAALMLLARANDANSREFAVENSQPGARSREPAVENPQPRARSR